MSGRSVLDGLNNGPFTGLEVTNKTRYHLQVTLNVSGNTREGLTPVRSSHTYLDSVRGVLVIRYPTTIFMCGKGIFLCGTLSRQC